MIEAYKLFWLNFFKLKGRSRRRDFWWPMLINIILSSILGLMIFGITRIIPYSDVVYNTVATIINVVILIGTFTVSIRRFHDIGKTMIIPCIFFVISLYGCYVELMYDNGTANSSFEIHNQVLNIILGIIAILFTLLVIVISIMSLVYCVKDSQKGTNKYGPNPKEQ